MFRPLQDITLDDITQFGGKAARLGEALRLGCPVVPGAALSVDLYRRFMRQGGLQGEIASILATMQPSTMTHFQAAEWAIREAFHVRRIPAEVSDAVAQAFDLLGGAPVAVRSSATNEDSPHRACGATRHLFARGRPRPGARRVLGCWMSLYSAKALSYAHRFRVDLLNSAMACCCNR
jgi:pyruvate,water dikinase